MRKFARNSTDVPIELQVHSSEPQVLSDCKMTSVSFGGLSCEVEEKVMVGANVTISIPSVSPPYQGDGDVVWCKPIAQGYEIGIRFIDLGDITTSRMVQQVCQIEHYKKIVFDREGKWLDGKQVAEQWMKNRGV